MGTARRININALHKRLFIVLHLFLVGLGLRHVVHLEIGGVICVVDLFGSWLPLRLLSFHIFIIEYK